MNVFSRTQVTVPKRMRTLERDKRHFPIPYIVQRDLYGAPLFTINDQLRCAECVRKSLCAVCGKRMAHEMWFVGGSRCFTHERGAFIDPPVHYECGEYALKVCPFLASPSWAHEIGKKALIGKKLPGNLKVQLVQEHVGPLQPELFGIGMANGYVITPNRLFMVDNWHYIEWWRIGVQVNAPSADDVRRLNTTME